jgi:hypothetical protein
MTFPRLVERLDKRTALMLGCNACGHEWTASDPDDFISATDFGRQCEKCGSIATEPAYDEAPACGGCGVRGHWVAELDYCCSRACMLQKQYAAELAARKETTDAAG